VNSIMTELINNRLSRRTLLGTSAVAAAGLATGCSDGGGGSGSGGGGGAAGTVDWWDHFSSYEELNNQWADKQSKSSGTNVVHTYYDASKAPQAFQLAHQAKKMPDVFSNVIGLPLAALVSGNWLHELTLSDETTAKIGKESLTEGITDLDGKHYGFPLFSFRQSTGLLWLNKEHITKAGLDPANPPTDYAGVLDACRKLAAADIPPMTFALGDDGGRIGDIVEDMAQTAGFAGFEGLLFTTGEYAYHDDAYIEVIEFLKELNDSKFLLPGTNNFGVVDSRTRFASGVTGIYLDGIWCAGGAKALVPEFADKIGSGQVLVPSAGTDAWCYRGRPGASYFVAASTDDPEAATALIESMTTDEYQQGMIAAMDQPPLNLDLVQSSDALDAYKSAVAFCAENVFLMPQAIVKNPDIAAVDARRKPITPSIGNIIQGYLGGSLKDLRAELKKLSDANEADREKAIEAAKGEGAEVSMDDFVFDDWKPGQDYEVSGS
jgi:ABC-type glycerol-3-phosphate transport system substrate-binding protein